MANTNISSILRRWDDVLSPKECAHFISSMQTATSTEGLVLRGGREILARDTRVCLDHKVAQTVRDEFSERIAPLQGEILESFGLRSCVTNGPYFVSYGPGAFFRLHQDTGHHVDDPQVVTDRLLSLVLYLNGREATTETPAFDGGAFAIYDPLLPGLRGRHIVVPQPGTLIVFKSECFHEVLTVHEGIRYSVILWYLRYR
jgi:predicted 2-oxoglutarate/Fe(II)-dependent dioxygenase YbiX